MPNRASRLTAASFVAAIALTLPTRGGHARPIRPAAPRIPAPAAPDDDATRGHPAEDLACTVVRETAHGTVIITVRVAPIRAATTALDPGPLPRPVTPPSANGAPILD